MIQSLFLITEKGETLIEKHYRGYLSRDVVSHFWTEVQKAPSPTELLPVITHVKNYLVHVHRNDFYLLAVVAREVEPLLVLEFLHRVIDTFSLYFPETKEGSIRKNFILIYQLLDEMMDGGHPFTTEPNMLMEMFPPPNIGSMSMEFFTGEVGMGGNVPNSNTTNTPWRKTGVRHLQNEIYFDITEELDATIDSNGMCVTSEVSGEVLVNCKLSGMPDCSLTFHNAHILDDVSFHPCVRYQRYAQSKVVSFVPPDGKFKLMDYRVKGNLQIPIYVKPQITFSSTGGRISLQVGTKISTEFTIDNVVIELPLPKNAGSPSLTPNMGKATYDDQKKLIKWNIGKLTNSGKTPLLEGTLGLSGSAPEGNNMVTVNFRISQYAASGLRVDTLTIFNEDYKPYKGVKFATKSGRFSVRG